MAITLGKDATVSFGGEVTGVRNVTFSSTAKTIDVEEYGTRAAYVYSVGQDAVVTMELNDDSGVSGLLGDLIAGDEINVSGGQAGWAFTAVITAVNESASVDGVVTFSLEARMTKSGLRQ